MNSKDISLTAMLGALSAVVRIPFAALPSVQPSTFIIAATGYSFGPLKGLAAGALTAILSSFFLGWGPWSLFQMLAWGLCGAFFGLLSRFKLPVWALAIFAFLWGYIFGFITNLWYLTGFGFPLTMKSIISVQAASFWFDTMHAISNAAFFLIFGKRVIAIFERFRQRLF
jgi:energy-coupling factor transport system substrate-specific component